MMMKGMQEQGVLQSRPVPIHKETVPRVDENMDVFLLCGGRVISRPTRAKLLACALEGAYGRFPNEQGGGIFALLLPECERAALVTPLATDIPGTAVAVIPHISLHSVYRVLQYAFDGQVSVVGDTVACTQEAVRQGDVGVYEYLRWLITCCRSLASETGLLKVADRRQLSQCLLSGFLSIERLLGVEFSTAHQSAFPVAYPFCGTLHTSRALWMQLLLVLGLRRGFSARVWDAARLIADDELILPALEIPVGNRTPLPGEWEECVRIARQTDTFFDIRRHRNRILVRFCPVTPHVPVSEFYSVRAMAPMIEGIREMKGKSIP